MDFDIDLSKWALVSVDTAENAGEDNQKEKEQGNTDMDQNKERENSDDPDTTPFEQLDPVQQEKLAEVNTEKVHQDFYQLDSFHCFHDMLFMQELFTDTVLEQIALHQTKFLDAAKTVKRNIEPALPLAEQKWRNEFSKLVVKGEAFVMMIGALHKDLDSSLVV